MRKQIFIKIIPAIVCFLAFLVPERSLAQEKEDVPPWLKRFEYSVQVESDRKPRFYLQTVQPLHQSTDLTNTVFIQPRVNLINERTTYNLGVGYRRLASENWILGANLFGDYQSLHEHGRVGVGLEALGQIVEARLNSYFGISPKRIIGETPTVTTIERVADGLDLEFGVPVPYTPWLKLYGSGFWYDLKKFDDKFGWKTRLEARVNEAVRLEVYTWDDNKGEREVGGRIRFNVAFNSIFDFKDAFKFSPEPFPKKDLEKELLIPVERNFEITVEKYTEAGGLTVEAGRS